MGKQYLFQVVLPPFLTTFQSLPNGSLQGLVSPFVQSCRNKNDEVINNSNNCVVKIPVLHIELLLYVYRLSVDDRH